MPDVAASVQKHTAVVIFAGDPRLNVSVTSKLLATETIIAVRTARIGGHTVRPTSIVPMLLQRTKAGDFRASDAFFAGVATTGGLSRSGVSGISSVNVLIPSECLVRVNAS